MAVPVPIAVGDVIRAVYFQQLFGQRINTVLHLVSTVAPATGTTYAQAMQNLADRLGTVSSPPLQDWIPIVTPELVFGRVRAQRVWPARAVYMESLIGDQGSNTGTATMSNDAVSVEKRTLRPGRAGVGRVQMAGVPADQIVAGFFQSTYLGQVDSAWESLLGELTVAADSSKWRFCLFHNAAVTEDDWLFDVVAMPEVRTMHRRTVGLGE